ncbi:hypothetical protein ACJVC5_07855 [Peredibacter sp. HCB2-198]|uniref:hypothetical protein n=1 Tax=Peredibacter sp. HCB2-198 TaxID=3383025 RepID=UPI0038B58283
MKKQYVNSVILGTTLLQLIGCSGQVSSGKISSGNIISGVAATGAPISGGLVRIKGSNGQIVEDTTSSSGTYSANISALQEPYLVQVIAPSGEKYISVASQSALAEGKKVNVTPLTHSIVANVFGNADGDAIFSNFQNEASEYSDQKLEDEKTELVQKFIDAGLLGDGKIAAGNIDLLNGDFVAGSGQGIDGLLDVISVNPDASAGIEISLKGSNTPIITDVVTGASDPIVVAITPTELTTAKEQLSVLDQIRARMNSLAALHSSFVSCNGAPVDNGGACDVDTLYAAFAPYFHANYQENGNSGDAGVWSWFCRDLDDHDEAESRSECLDPAFKGAIKFENVSLKDITLIKYDEINKVALISFNFYLNGVLKGSEDMTLKYDNIELKYDLLGNRRTFDYWIETEALYNTAYNKTSNTGVDSYSMNLNFYMDDDKAHNFTGNESLTLTAASGHQIFPGNSSSMTVYLVKGPMYDSNGQCTSGVTFSTTQTPYRLFNPNTGAETFMSYEEACPNNGDPCNNGCGMSYYDHDRARKTSLTDAQIMRMDKIERITMVGGSVNDEFVIKKPLIINAYNAPTYIPTFGMTAANFCEEVNFTTQLNLKVESGLLNYVGLSHSYSLDNVWANENENEDFWDQNLSSKLYSPSFSASPGATIHYSYLHISSRDEFDRQFVRRVICSENQQ